MIFIFCNRDRLISLSDYFPSIICICNKSDLFLFPINMFLSVRVTTFLPPLMKGGIFFIPIERVLYVCSHVLVHPELSRCLSWFSMFPLRIQGLMEKETLMCPYYSLLQQMYFAYSCSINRNLKTTTNMVLLIYILVDMMGFRKRLTHLTTMVI